MSAGSLFNELRFGVPSISVVMTCYNRERHIEQAIRSIQAQVFDGTLEIVVADDLSSDQTVQLVAGMQAADPRIVLLRSDRRLGVSRNFARAIAHAKGTYLATLDDDDFWIDPGKCQRQFDYLEQHANVSGVFESVLIVDENGETIRDHVVAKVGRSLARYDFVSEYPLTTQTVMIRRSACAAFPEWGYATSMQDWVFAWQASQHGLFVCTGGISAAYRQSRASLWASMSPRKKLIAYFNMVELLNRQGALGVDQCARERQSAHADNAFRDYVDHKFSLWEAFMIAWVLSRRRVSRQYRDFLRKALWVLKTYCVRAKKGLV